jgi:hypothetical protein
MPPSFPAPSTATFLLDKLIAIQLHLSECGSQFRTARRFVMIKNVVRQRYIIFRETARKLAARAKSTLQNPA